MQNKETDLQQLQSELALLRSKMRAFTNELGHPELRTSSGIDHDKPLHTADSSEPDFTILLVDDSITSRKAVRQLIERSFNDIAILETESGLQAIELLKEESVDLILMDIQMPNVNGFETAKRLRSSQSTADTPIIFITAYDPDGKDKIIGLEIGALDYISKHLEESELERLLQIYIRFVKREKNIHNRLLLTNSKLLRQIDERLKTEAELKKLNDVLEERVEERTAELLAEIDIRRNAEEALQRSGDQLKSFINALDDPFFVKDSNRRYVILNDAACKLLARSREDLIGKQDEEVLSDLLVSDYIDNDSEVLSKGKTVEQELRFSRDGSEMIVSVKKTAFIDYISGNRYIASTARDITEQKEIESIMRSRGDILRAVSFTLNRLIVGDFEESKLTEALEQIGIAAGVNKVAIYENDPVDTYKAELRFLWRQQSDEDDYKPLQKSLSFRNSFFNKWHDQLSKGNAVSGKTSALSENEKKYFENFGIHAFSFFPIQVNSEWHSTLCFFDTKHPRNWNKEELEALKAAAGTMGAVFQNKEAEMELLDSERKYRELITNAPIGIMMINKQGRITDANPKLLEIIGTPGFDLLYRINALQFPPFIIAGLSDVILNTLENGTDEAGDLPLQTQWKEDISIRYHVTPVRDEKGSIEAAQAIVEDITKRKQAEQELIDIKMNLEQMVNERTVELENANDLMQLEISERENTEKLQTAVYEISQMVDIEESIEIIFRKVHQTIRTVMAAENFYIALFDETNNLVEFPYSESIDEGSNKMLNPELELTEYVMRKGSTLLCTPKVRKKMEEEKEISRVQHMSEAFLGVPLMLDNTVIGAMAALHFEDPHAFTKKHVRMLEFIAAEVSRVIRRRRAEKELRDSEQRYRSVFETSFDALMFLDRRTIRDCNQSALNMFGFTNKWEILRHFSALSPDFQPSGKTSRRAADEYIQQAYESGSARFEWVHQRSDGSTFFTDVLLTPFEHGGEIILQANVRDMTDRKQAEQLRNAVYRISKISDEVQYVEELFTAVHTIIQEIMSAKNFYIALIDERNDQITFPYFSDEFDSPPQPKPFGKGFTEYVIRTEKPLLVNKQKAEELLEAGEVEIIGSRSSTWLGVPLIVDKKSIGMMAVQHYSNPEAHGEQELQILEFVSSEVSRVIYHAKAEEALRKSEKRFRNLFENSPDGIIVLDYDNKILDINPAGCRLLNQRRNDVIGNNVANLASTKPLVDALPDQTNMNEIEGRNFEAVLKKDDLQEITIELNMSRFEFTGKPALLLHARDVTDRKEIEEALLREKENAEQANRLKSQFVFNVSHEIRTPLNAIIGLSEAILSRTEPDEIHNYSNNILRESDNLLTLVGDLLDHAKIEAGKMMLESLPFDLQELLESIINSTSALVSSKDLQFKVVVKNELPRFLIGDSLRLRQVLMNLISNAVKFTEEGSVELIVDLLDKKEEEVTVRFAVKDTGIGIPEEQQKNIFKSFTQADGSTTRKFGGTGLGTTIAKQLVGLMGGTIALESEINRGSTFWFDVSLAIEKSPEKRANLQGEVVVEEEEGIFIGNILVVEDYPTNQQVARLHLEEQGHRVTIAGNGKLALAECEWQTFDLILMDVQMPEMDGYAATKHIRNGETLCTNIPIIALTAHADATSRKNCLDAGMNDVITKPIRRKHLLETVHHWMKLIKTGSNIEQIDMNDYIETETENETAQKETVPFDLEEAIEVFGDLDTVMSIMSEFLENVEKQQQIIDNALENQDFETIRKEAHSVKGGAASIEAQALSASAKSLEFAAKDKNYDLSKDVFSVFISDFNTLKDVIRNILENPAT